MPNSDDKNDESKFTWNWKFWIPFFVGLLVGILGGKVAFELIVHGF